MLQYRLLTTSEARPAASIHRRASALIPGYDINLHTLDEFYAFYENKVMIEGPIWGAFENDVLRGHAALSPGWIEHLYVDPEHHGSGIGSALTAPAQRKQDELRLYTFQTNSRARRMYERSGFIVEKLSDGNRNEEKMPDVLYHWVQTQ